MRRDLGAGGEHLSRSESDEARTNAEAGATTRGCLALRSATTIEGNPAYWGENRTRLLNRAKIFLNIPRFRGEFAGMRMALAAANKTMVLSEPLYQPEPFVPGKHFVSAEVDEMPGVIAWYLELEQERERIAEDAHRFVVEAFTMERSLRTLLDLIQERLRGRRQ